MSFRPFLSVVSLQLVRVSLIALLKQWFFFFPSFIILLGRLQPSQEVVFYDGSYSPFTTGLYNIT